MRKIILLALLLFALTAATASASVSASWADSQGRSVARSDCGRAWDWFCWYFPQADSVYSCAANRWCVSVAYGEQSIWGYNRTCWTDTHWAISNGALTYNTKYC